MKSTGDKLSPVENVLRKTFKRESQVNSCDSFFIKNEPFGMLITIYLCRVTKAEELT